MTDKELLERAAEACGFVYVGIDHEDYTQDWNPLRIDADAFQLAVKLGIQFNIVTMPHAIGIQAFDGRNLACFESYKDDPYAATRRAIVRVAAGVRRSKI